MVKENQRVVDLSNVDTKAKAFILGMQCGFQYGNQSVNLLNNGILRVTKPWMYTDYDVFKKFVEEEFDANVLVEDSEKQIEKFLRRAREKHYEIDINEYRWMRCYRYYNAYIRITDESLCYISDALPMLKKEFFPYLLFGLFYNSGGVSKESLWFMTSFRAAKTLQKQFKQWYGIDAVLKQPLDPKGSRFGCLNIIGEEQMKKFMNILPNDYIEVFEKKWQRNQDFQSLFEKKQQLNVKKSLILLPKC